MSFRIEHRIGVAAPPAEVWELVRDLDGWKDWTGLYSAAGGQITIGETLRFTYQLGERAPTSVEAVVFDWVPEAQLAWKAKLPGNIRSLRYVEIEKLSETNCILSNGEYFSGFGRLFMDRPLRRDIRAAFTRMNEKAKRISEERFAAKGGPVSAPSVDTAAPIELEPMRLTSMGGKPWGFGKSGGFGPRLNPPAGR